MADARIKITADGAQAEATMRRLGDSADGLGGRFLSLTGLAGGLGGALSIGAFASFIKNTIDGIDALNDLHDATGASIELLSGLEDRAARTGTSMDTVGTALVKFNQQLNEAKPGSQTELNLKAIGLSAEELKKIDPAEALRLTAVALAGYTDDGNKARLVQDLFGKSVREVAPLLKDLAEGGALAAKVTTEQAQAAEDFNKQLFELQKNAKDSGRALSTDLMSGLSATLKAFSDVEGGGNALRAVGGGIATVFETVVVLGSEVAFVFTSIGREIGGIAAQFSALGEGGGIFSKEGRAAWAQVRQEMQADAAAARADLDAFQAKVMSRSAPQAAAPGGGRPEKPGLGPMADPAALKAAQAEAEKLRQQDTANLVKHAEAVDRANFEEAKAIANKQVAENERQAASELTWQQGVAKRMADIQTSNMSIEELERGHLAAIQNDLQAARELGFLTEQQYNELIYQETVKSQAKLGDAVAQGTLARQKFTQMSAMQQTNTVLGEMVRMTQGVAATNRELFEINKIAGIAQASIDMYQGAQRTWGAYPYPLNIPMTALSVATSLAHIQAINSAQFGSSTSAPTVAGGGAIPVFNAGGGSALPLPSVPGAQQQSPTELTIVLQGSAATPMTFGDFNEKLVPMINEAAANGALRITTTYA